MPAGLVLLTPTSVTKTGTGSSATINTNGSVTYSSCVTLLMNGVFSATYDNYLVVCRHTSSNASDSVYINYATGGTATTSSSHAFQDIRYNGTSQTGNFTSNSSISYVSDATGHAWSGFTLDIYDPFKTSRTLYRSVAVYSGNSNATVQITEASGVFTGTTSFDGLRLDAGSSGGMTGLVCVYGRAK